MVVPRAVAGFLDVGRHRSYLAVGNEEGRLVRGRPGDIEARRIVLDEPRVNPRPNLPVEPFRFGMKISMATSCYDREREQCQRGRQETAAMLQPLFRRV